MPNGLNALFLAGLLAVPLSAAAQTTVATDVLTTEIEALTEDAIFIPPGALQRLTVDTPVKSVVVHIDPDKMLPAGYVNPLLKQ